MSRRLLRLAIRRQSPGVSSRCHLSWPPSAHWASTANQTKDNEPESRSKEPGKRSRGSYARVLAVLATSAAAGYAFRSWQKKKRAAGNIAKPGDFVKYALVGKEDISSTCSIFTLRPAGETVVDTGGLLDKRALTSLQFKQPQIQVARNYTLLPPIHGQDPLELRFLIKKERNGEVSNYIHRLGLGSEIEIRGPSVEYVMPERVQSIVFLAGGTGIAPAIQLAAKRDDQTHMEVLWASRKREECQGGVSDTKPDSGAWRWNSLSLWRSRESGKDLAARSSEFEENAVVAQLNDIRSRGKPLKVHYHVDEEGTMIRPADVSQRLRSTQLAGSGDRLVFISGPEGFVDHWAGPKQWAGGREVQGPLGGVLGSMNLKDWKVVKL